MKYFLLIIFCLVYTAKSQGQVVTNLTNKIDVEITKEKKPRRIYTKVEIKSAHPEGDSSWAQFLEKKLNQSIRVDKRVKKGTYLVTIQFIVMRDSSIADTKCITDPGFGMCQEVLRVIRKYHKWGFRPGPVILFRRSSIISPESNRR
jgi:hypothetical protein